MEGMNLIKLNFKTKSVSKYGSKISDSSETLVRWANRMMQRPGTESVVGETMTEIGGSVQYWVKKDAQIDPIINACATLIDVEDNKTYEITSVTDRRVKGGIRHWILNCKPK